MFRNLRIWTAAPAAAGLIFLGIFPAAAQTPARNSRIDVQDYAIDAEISPNTQSLTAKCTVNFTPMDDGLTNTTFELNNALNVSRVTDSQGKQIETSRTQQDFSIRVNFEQPLPKGQPYSITFYYDGKFTGDEESPVYGIKFAAIHPDFAFLTYPARWFPVSGYTTDRFGADIRVTVPTGFAVVGSGTDSNQAQADKTVYEFKFARHSFPGSIAVVKGPPANIASEGAQTAIYFRGQEAGMPQVYGDETGKMMTYFTSLFGLPPNANLTLVETEAGAPNGYAAPGLIFLSPQTIGSRLNSKVLANQVSRQWWEELVSPVSRNQLWVENGMATYSELLWTEHAISTGAMEAQMRSEMVAALTVDNLPVIQAGRLEDYSPELWALTGSKGASVLNMLRHVMGDDKFFLALKNLVQQNTWKQIGTDELRKSAEEAIGQSLDYFFIQWIESSGAPEFKLDYTVFRVHKGGGAADGFRVMGKITQDLDTFRMPVTLKIETEGNPEEQKVEVMGTSSEFSVDTFGKPKKIVIDPNNQVLRYDPDIRVAVAIRRGEQFMQLGEFGEAQREYSKALETKRTSSLANYRIAEAYFLQNDYQDAANKFRSALDGDLDPKWTEVWSHIHLGWIYDISGQRDRAVDQYNQAIRTKDNTQGAQDEASKYLKTAYQRERRDDR